MSMEIERTQVAQDDFDKRTSKIKVKRTANPVGQTLWSSVDGIDGWTPDMVRPQNDD